MQTIGDWLSGLSSHNIYDAEKVAADFVRSTGHEPCWSTHSAAETRAAIEARGLGGSLEGDGPTVAGYQIAMALAYTHADKFRSPRNGRGSIFWECVARLKEKGV